MKVRLLSPDDSIIASDDLPASTDDQGSSLDQALSGMEDVDAVGHRVVHGGTRFSEAARIDRSVMDELRSLVDLAPLHQPKALDAIDAVTRALPEVPAVACFDTSFHARMPVTSTTYAVPREWRERWGIRRFGFHGLSHSYAARRTAELLDRSPGSLRIVTCHLGAGASLAAVERGRSVDTTMGFTPLEGLVMATRSGSIDPGIVLWMQDRGGLAAEEVGQALEHRSGLVALAGTSGMREIVQSMDSDDEARLAFDVYVHHVRAGVAAMAASMGGVDAVAFTGGVGGNSAEVRAGVADGLGFLGMEVDAAANQGGRRDADISAGAARTRTLVIEAREDIEIAREVRRVLGGG